MRKPRPITKARALRIFRVKGPTPTKTRARTKKALCDALGITRQAFDQWKDGPIPEVHDLKIRYELRPELFGRPKESHEPAIPAD